MTGGFPMTCSAGTASPDRSRPADRMVTLRRICAEANPEDLSLEDHRRRTMTAHDRAETVQQKKNVIPLGA